MIASVAGVKKEGGGGGKGRKGNQSPLLFPLPLPSPFDASYAACDGLSVAAPVENITGFIAHLTDFFISLQDDERNPLADEPRKALSTNPAKFGVKTTATS